MLYSAVMIDPSACKKCFKMDQDSKKKNMEAVHALCDQDIDSDEAQRGRG